MPNTCFVPNCRSGYRCKKKVDSDKISLFAAPKEENLFKVWQKKIPREDRKLTKKDYVCALHFNEKDILRFFENKLPSGEIDLIARGKPALKKGAVPCIFPNCPPHLSRILRERKPPKIRIPIQPKPEVINNSPELEIANEQSYVINDIGSNPCPPNFNSFGENLILPPYWIRNLISDQCLLFLRLCSGKIDRHLLVSDEFKTAIYLNNTQIQIQGFETCPNEEILMSALDKISAVKLCASQINR